MPAAKGKQNDDGSKPTYKCEQCDKSYSRMEYLRRHERKHADSKPFPCPGCSKSFARSDVLLRHKRKCHAGVDFDNVKPSVAGPSSPSPNKTLSQTSQPTQNGVASSSGSGSGSSTSIPPSDADRSPPFAYHLADSPSSLAEPRTSISSSISSSSTRDSRRADAAPYSIPTRRDLDQQYHHHAYSPPPPAYPPQHYYGSTSSDHYHYYDHDRHNSNDSTFSTASSASYPPPGSCPPSSSQSFGPVVPSPSLYPYKTHASGEYDDPSGQFSFPQPSYASYISNQQQHQHQQQQQPPIPIQPSPSQFFSAPPLTSSSNPSYNDPSRQAFLGPSRAASNLFSPPIATPLYRPDPPFVSDERSNVPATQRPNPPARRRSGFPFPSSSYDDMRATSSTSTLPSASTASSSELSNGRPNTRESGAGPPTPELFASFLGGFSPGSVLPQHPGASFLFEGLGGPVSAGNEPHLAASREPGAFIFDLNDEPGLLGEEDDEVEADSIEPERKMVNSDLLKMRARGETWSVAEPTESDLYWVPPERFLACYAIDHWQMPPIWILLLVARRTVNQLIPHAPLIHPPTFALKDQPLPLAFACCTIGGPKRGQQARWDSQQLGAHGYPLNLLQPESDETDSWDGLRTIVRKDKTEMLVQGFFQAKGDLFTDYNIGLLQALILYHMPQAISDVQELRESAFSFIGTLVIVARSIGLFSPLSPHVSPHDGPDGIYEDTALKAAWKRWIKAESIRRTTYIVYVLDSLASLELPSSPSHVLPSELASFPLPASDELWLAPDEAAWSHAMHAASYSVSNSTVARPPMTLCHLLYRLCHPHTHGSLSGGAGAEILRLGPFGWLVGVLALLKAALDCGEGRERDPGADWLNGIPDEQLPAAINQALEFWRQGFDYDDLCGPAAPVGVSDDDCPCTSPSNASREWHEKSNGGSPSEWRDSLPHVHGAPRLPYSDAVFIREALPFYWTAKHLVGQLQPPALISYHLGVNYLGTSGINYASVLHEARKFTRSREGRAG